MLCTSTPMVMDGYVFQLFIEVYLDFKVCLDLVCKTVVLYFVVVQI